VLNSPGTVDADYRGEIVILVNLSNETFVIQNGERIALIIAKHERADWIEVQELSNIKRRRWIRKYRSKVVLK
jgi:dUTP pyrophosphatase